MAGWRCFVIKPSPFCRRSLRKYTDAKCPLTSWIHNASVVVDERLELGPGEEGGFLRQSHELDPRWPKSCSACGHVFSESDHWQVNVVRLYEGCPDGRLRALRDPDLPPGAMWDADWLPDNYRGPDGKAWCIWFPGGMEWPVFGPSADGNKWAISGTAPAFTAHPSINITGVYHGHVREGVITEDAEGRTFPDLPRTA